MANKDENWIAKYNKYKKMDFDVVIAKSEEEIAKKTEKGEDTTKLNEKIAKFKRIQENMPKIENLKTYLDKAKQEKQKLEEQKKLIEDLKTAPDKMKSMEEKMKAIEEDNKKLEAEIESIDKQIKANKDKPEEKAKLEEQRKNTMKQYGANQAKYSKYQDEYTKNRDLLEQHAGQKLPTIEEIDNKLQDVNKTIEQCNFMCSELVEGKQMNEVLPALQEKFAKKDKESQQQPSQEQPSEEQPSQEEKVTKSKMSLKDRFMNFLAKHPKIAAFVNKVTGDRFVPELEAADTSSEPIRDEEEQAIEPEKEENSFRDDLKVAQESEQKNENANDVLQYQLLEAIAEHGEKSTIAQKIASQIKLQKYVQGKTGEVIGTKVDAVRYKDEQYQMSPKNSGMKAALAAQDKLAVGRAYLPKENDDEGR